MSTTAPHHPSGGSAPSRRAWPASRVAGILVAAVLLAVIWQAGGFRVASDGLFRAYDAMVEAQLAMLDARGHIGADGIAEYAVLAADGHGGTDIEAFLEGFDHATYRRASVVPDWHVLGVEQTRLEVLEAMKAAGIIRLSLPNRGAWICH